MNHLAHFLLCPADDEWRAGTLIADHVRGADLRQFSAGTEAGIRLHRRVDALVDSSPLIIGLKPLVGAPLRRYAGILFDVFFDYALIRQWPALNAPHLDDQSLPAFTAQVYASLARQEAHMPDVVRAVSARMRHYDALSSCATQLGCVRTLDRIATRLKRPVNLSEGIDTLMRHESTIVDTLTALWPTLQAQVQDYLKQGRST